MIIENKELGIRFGVKGNEDFEKWLAEHDKQIRADAIEEMKELIYQFDNYCASSNCKDCWMNADDSSCLELWINSKSEQLKEQK